MSAWPEAVWLKQQVANLLDIKDLQQEISDLEAIASNLSKETNKFINNEFFTTIIPEEKFSSFTIDQQNIINFRDDVIKVNSATVFLTTESSFDIETSLKLRFKGLKDTSWFLNTNETPQLPQDRVVYYINFTIDSQSYTGLQITTSTITGLTGENDSIIFYNANEGGWSSDIDFSNITFIDGIDIANSSLISWLYANGSLKED